MSYYIIESKRFQRGLPISFIILKSWIKDDIYVVYYSRWKGK